MASFFTPNVHYFVPQEDKTKMNGFISMPFVKDLGWTSGLVGQSDCVVFNVIMIIMLIIMLRLLL